MKPRMMQADQAADLLGIHVFQLARALRNEAASAAERQAGVISRGDERPNFGDTRRLLWAAEACEEAWDALIEVRDDEVVARLDEQEQT
jgi:hypothetical protein